MDITSAKPDALHPVSTHERIDLIDVVRGFALFGVLLANLVWLTTGGRRRHLCRSASLRTLGVMYATAVVEGKVVRLKLSPALARAHRKTAARQ